MIKIYYRKDCTSSQHVFCWFEKYPIDVRRQHINTITRSDIIKLLQYSDEGLTDILKSPRKSKSKVRQDLRDMEHLCLNEALDFIVSHPYVLCTPIIMDDNKILIGYNPEQIRMFLPKEYRRKSLGKNTD
ncbi:ArsC/Spx/MgsR family protein [Lactococcus formosensis]|uniref:ArsC/Spx/MgsR family protein n=1 Tax=Lactococcus formosensis TaxID=1281486 RepID=UPI0024352ACF|nr:ArsC/Spx/MgsR family protein [Lactococcus formosensis]